MNVPHPPFALLLILLLMLAIPSAGLAGDGALAERQQAFQQAVAAADPSIVRIETVGGVDLVGEILTGTGPTSGVVVREDGYIITSRFNFIARPASILVTLPDGENFAAEVVAEDHSKMLTLLKIEKSGLTPIEAAPKEEIRVGQSALALGRTLDLEFPNVSAGIVSARNRVWGRALQTDAKVSPVNYGGPLVDLRGRCLGILVPLSPDDEGETAGVEWYDSGIGFAVPLADVQRVLERMIEGESLHRGLLGVSFVDRGQLSGEAKLIRVRPESPAAEAGLKVDDVVLEVDGDPVEKLNDFKHLLGSRYAGDTVTLKVRREDQTIETRARLVEELRAYQFPSLGILPERDVAEEGGGVAVRHVFSESPAEQAGLQTGDLITRVGDEEVSSEAELARLVRRSEPGTTIELTVVRQEQEQTLSAKLEPFPNDPPGEFDPVSIPPPDAEPEVRTGRFNQELPGSEQNFWMYVPETYNPAGEYGLLVWLHPAGDTMEAEMMRAWAEVCSERGLILLAPRAGDVSGWAPEQEDVVQATVEWVRERYRVDPRRIAVMGQEDSGLFATRLAFKYRDLFRGLIGLSTLLRVPPPDNDPEFRLQTVLVSSRSGAQRPLIEKSVETLRERKFPAFLLDVPEGERHPLSGRVVRTLALWLDALDRV